MDDLKQVIADIQQTGKFCVDLETTSQYPVLAKLVGLALCCEEGKACYIPVGHIMGEQLPKDEVLKLLAPLLEDESLPKIGQNIKYDLIVLLKEGVDSPQHKL